MEIDDAQVYEHNGLSLYVHTYPPPRLLMTSNVI